MNRECVYLFFLVFVYRETDKKNGCREHVWEAERVQSLTTSLPSKRIESFSKLADTSQRLRLDLSCLNS